MLKKISSKLSTSLLSNKYLKFVLIFFLIFFAVFLIIALGFWLWGRKLTPKSMVGIKKTNKVQSLEDLYGREDLAWEIEDSENGCPQKFYQIDLLQELDNNRWLVKMNQQDVELEIPCSEIKTTDRDIIKPYLLEEGEVVKLVIERCDDTYSAVCGVANKWWLENRYDEYTKKRTSWLFPRFSLVKKAYAEDCTKGGTECMVDSRCPTTRKRVPGCHPNPEKLQCVAGGSCSDPWLDWKCCTDESGGGDAPKCADTPLTLYSYARKLDFAANPSFEELELGGDDEDILGWENDGGDRDNSWNGRGPVHGSYFVKGRKFHMYQRVGGLVPGNRYLIFVRQTGRIKTHSGCREEASAEMLLSWDDDYHNQFLIDKSGGDRYWRTAEGEFIVPAGRDAVYIHLRGRHSNDNGWCKEMRSMFDWVEIFELCDEPEGCSGGGADGVIFEVRVDNGKESEFQLSNDGGASWGMIADPSSGAVSDGGWVPYGPLVYWSPAGARCVDNRFRNQRDDKHRVVQCDPVCFPIPFVAGYVWDDADDDGIQEAGESVSSEAEVRLAGPGVACDSGDPQDPSGFGQRVSEGESYRVCLDPSECYCETRWNDASPPTQGAHVRPYGGPDPLGYFYADVGAVGAEETKYAYLGIKKAGFKVALPTGALVVDPDEVNRQVPVNVAKISDCWDPPAGVVNINESDITITPNDGAIGVDSIDLPASLVPDYNARVNLKIEKRASYADSYNLCVKGKGDPTCLGEADDCVELKVEHIAWFQSEAGDVYGASEITSYIPTDATAASFRDELRFSELGPPYSYLSIAKVSPGLVLSGGLSEWGSGTVSVEGWEAEGYEIGFYDASDGYGYDFGYFETNLDSTCTLSGSARMAGGGLTDGSDNCFVDSHVVIKVNGNLEVEDAVGFAGEKAVILVDGSVTFKDDFDPSGYYALIASVDVAVASAVENVRALLLADGAIYDYDPGVDSEATWEDQENGLLIKGSAIALGSFDLRRTRAGGDADGDGDPVDDADDDLEAANYFAFDPELFLELSDILGTTGVRYTWRELE